jgi:hypothetical protein
MGEVYRAYDTVKDRIVALKRLHEHLAGNPGFQSQFRRESRIAARLREPHIIPIHDFGEINGRLYIDMRLVEGVDLATLLTQQGALTPDRAATIAIQVASALAAAHVESLVHRDVKPANVLVVGPDQGEDYVYLVDFGIARDTSATEFGPDGSMVGSAEYMAPEQFIDGQADHRSDIYSLGGLLYFTLTGRRPFSADGPAAQMYAHLHSPPPTPSADEPELPSGLDQVVATAMAKSPDDRYQSAQEFAAAVRAALASDDSVPAGGPDEPAATRFFGGGPMRMLGWNAEPAFGDLTRRVAEQAAAVAGSLGIPTIGPRKTDRTADSLGRDALAISLFVAEKVSRRAMGSASEAFWAKLRPAMDTVRNGQHEESPDPDETVVLTTTFGEGANRTVIEVRVPLAAAQDSDLDVDQLLSDAYTAANNQAMGDLRGKHVIVSADSSTRSPAAVVVTDASGTTAEEPD